LTSLSLHVATMDESSAQFSAPISWPANSAFFLVRQIGLMAFLASRNTKSPIAEAAVRQIATLYAVEATVRG
jgi:hypothetical protein